MIRAWIALLIVATCSAWAAEVQTGDGLGLSISDQARLTGVRVGDRTLPTFDEPGGFYYLDFGAADIPKPELVVNGDFTQGTEGWQFGPDWSIADDPDLYRRGKSACIAFPGEQPARSTDVQQLVPVTPGASYHFSLALKTEGFTGTPPHVWLGMLGQDGRTGSEPQISLSHSRRDSHGEWFTLQRSFTAGPQTHFVQVRFGIYLGRGTAWVDDVSLKPLAIDFEGMATPLSGTVTRRDDATAIECADPAAGLELTATLTGLDERIHIEGALRDTTGQDRAIMLWLRLPLALGEGWSFGYDINREVPVTDLPTCSHTMAVAPGQAMSQFAWSSVRDPDTGLALSVPMDQPRMMRLAYAGRYGYYVVFDLGLSPATAAFPQKASFACDLYRFEPQWGFRAATQRYYDLFPQFFTEWPQGHGSWSRCAWDWQAEERPLDYGVRWQVFNFHENRQIADDTAAGVETVVYIEPNGYWGWRLGIKPLPAGSEQPPYDELIAQVREVAATGERPAAARILQTGIFDAEGRYTVGGWVPAYGGAHWDCNSDPDLPDAEGAISNLGTESWDHVKVHCDSYGPTGLYTDAGPFRTQNFRREHFAWIAHPLSFDYETKRLCVPPLVHSYELYEWLRAKLDEQGWHFLMHWSGANAPTYLYGIHFGDTLGNEQLTYSLNENQYVVQRTLCYRKTLQAYLNSARDMPVERREYCCQQDLAYGFFSDPKHPVLGRAYVALQRELARAGWEPISGATVAPETVHLERFGRAADGNLHFTVRNEDDAPVEATVTLDRADLGELSGKLYQLVDDMFKADPPVELTGDTIVVPLIANGVRVVRIGTGQEMGMLWEPEMHRQYAAADRYVKLSGHPTLDRDLGSVWSFEPRLPAGPMGIDFDLLSEASEGRAWLRQAALAVVEANRNLEALWAMHSAQWAEPPELWPARPGWPIELKAGERIELPTDVLVNREPVAAEMHSVFPQITVEGGRVTVAADATKGLHPCYLQWRDGDQDRRWYFDVRVVEGG